jgi:hypothetical protein
MWRAAIAASLLLVRSAAAMSVDEAYAAIPHRRTVFDRGAATMSVEEADALDRLLALVDRAIVARVAKTGHDDVLAALRALELPERLGRVRALVTEAVVAERAYLTDGDRSAVPTASARLHEAYAELMRLYPGEGAHNRDAFYDYLCALDFL